MKINIRNNTFETNSSSTHSISLQLGIDENDLPENLKKEYIEYEYLEDLRVKVPGLYEVIIPNEDGHIIVKPNFISGAEIYVESIDKKLTALSIICLLLDNEKYKKNLSKVILDQTGAKEIYFDNIKLIGKTRNSAIDECYLKKLEFLLEDGNQSLLKSFIFNKSSNFYGEI